MTNWKEIIRAIKNNNCSSNFNLPGKEISDIDAKDLGEALKYNTTIVSLHGVGDVGVIALAEALKENKSLEYLGLQGNSIGDDGALALLGAVMNNSKLNELKLDGNHISSEVLDEIYRLVYTKQQVDYGKSDFPRFPPSSSFYEETKRKFRRLCFLNPFFCGYDTLKT
eukprot:gene11315-3352_t